MIELLEKGYDQLQVTWIKWSRILEGKLIDRGSKNCACCYTTTKNIGYKGCANSSYECPLDKSDICNAIGLKFPFEVLEEIEEVMKARGVEKPDVK